MEIYLPFIKTYGSQSGADRILMELYRDYHDIPDDVAITVSSRDAFAAVAAYLDYDLDETLKYLRSVRPMKCYNPLSVQAHMLTRIVLEDLYQNEEVDTEYYPTEWGDDEDNLIAIMEEFDMTSGY